MPRTAESDTFRHAYARRAMTVGELRRRATISSVTEYIFTAMMTPQKLHEFEVYFIEIVDFRSLLRILF